MSRRGSSKKQIKGQQKLFSFFSRASDPKPILKSKLPTGAVAATKLFGKGAKQPSPAHSARKQTPTPETLKRKVPTAVAGGGAVVADAKGLVDSPSSTTIAKSDIEPQVGSSVRVFSAKENIWHQVSVYDYRENEDKHFPSYKKDEKTKSL